MLQSLWWAKCALGKHVLHARTLEVATCRWLNGIPTREEINKKARDEESDDPFDYTLFGNERKSKNPFHYTDRKIGRGYWDYNTPIFPYRQKYHPAIERVIKKGLLCIFVLMVGIAVDYRWLKQKLSRLLVKFRPEAATGKIESSEMIENTDSIDEENETDSKEKRSKESMKIGFRERRIVEYENRLRIYSAPDKIFRYFATLKVLNENNPSRPFEIYMTPQDFVRALTPGIMQPRGLGLDKYKIYHPNDESTRPAESNSIFAQLDKHALISFADYLFLMTVLSTSQRDFILAFRIFDVNGDGELDMNEFEKVQELLMSQTYIGQRHRDHAAVGLYASKHINTMLCSHFFGKDGTQKLSVEKFLDFQAQLHRDILKIELERRAMEFSSNDSISEVSFADMLLVYSNISETKRRKMLKRVKAKCKTSANYTGVTLDEVESFFCFLYFIDDVDLSLHLYNAAGVGVDSEILKMVASKVVGREISDHVIDVVITLFDENEDGLLSRNEFVSIMKKRVRRGLRIPRDTGLLRISKTIRKCAFWT